MNLSASNCPVLEPHCGDAFTLSPVSIPILLAESANLPDCGALRKRFCLLNLIKYFKIHRRNYAEGFLARMENITLSAPRVRKAVQA